MKALQFRRMLGAFLAEQDGVTAIEYALLAALIFGVIVGSVGLMGESASELYKDVATKVAAATQ